MKSKKKIIIASVTALLAAGAIIGGTTYALFNSESKADVAIKSSKIDVKVEVVKDSIKTKQLGENEYTDGNDNMFEGTVTVEDGKISLINLVPGDAVKFNLKVTNNSTVTTKMRTKVMASEDDGLASGLSININDEVFPGLAISKWAEVEKDSEDEIVTVEIELPKDAGNDYMDKTCTLTYDVEAVQANADVKDATVVTPTTTSLSLEDGMDIYFAPGEYNDYMLFFHGKENISLYGTKGANFTTFTAGYHSNQDKNYEAKTNSSILIDGLNVEKILNVNIADQSFTVSNCKASQIMAKQFVVEGSKIVFKDNTLKRTVKYAEYNAIKNGGIFLAASATNYDLVVEGNSFENYIGHAMRVESSCDGSSNVSANSITIKNNNFISFGYAKPNETEFSTDAEAAFKIWDDLKYTPSVVTEETTALQQALADDIKANNTFGEATKGHGFYVAQFYSTNYYEL